jgi:dCTP deaminase
VCLFGDKALVENIAGASTPWVIGLKRPDDWYGSDSPIQAASVDLHIGKIFVPGRTGEKEGSEHRPLTLHALEPGQTAIVSTLETLRLPSHIAAIGFPPSHISVKGLLMTNPGHVDPGYSGPMRFTVINMGKVDYTLSHGDQIVTLLFLQVSPVVQKNWVERHDGKSGRLPNQNDLDRLSPDFLDVGARAEAVAKIEVANEGIRLKRREIIGSILAAVGSAVILAVLYSWSGVQDLKSKVAELDKSLSVTQLQQRVEQLEQERKMREAKNSQSASPAARSKSTAKK